MQGPLTRTGASVPAHDVSVCLRQRKNAPRPQQRDDDPVITRGSAAPPPDFDRPAPCHRGPAPGPAFAPHRRSGRWRRVCCCEGGGARVVIGEAAPEVPGTEVVAPPAALVVAAGCPAEDREVVGVTVPPTLAWPVGPTPGCGHRAGRSLRQNGEPHSRRRRRWERGRGGGPVKSAWGQMVA